MRPMFMDVMEMLGSPRSGGTTPDTALAAMNVLNALFKNLLLTVKEETLVMEQIFPNPSIAIVAFINRVFEQRIKVCRSLHCPKVIGLGSSRIIVAIAALCTTQACSYVCIIRAWAGENFSI